MAPVQFELVDNALTAEDFLRLKGAAGFADRPLRQVDRALQNGLFNVCAVCEGKVVGMGRLVGDGALYWYVQEVVVLPEYQGKGIGKAIVGRLLDHIRRCAIPGTQAHVGLIAVEGKESFYEQFGFAVISTGMRQWMDIDA